MTFKPAPDGARRGMLLGLAASTAAAAFLPATAAQAAGKGRKPPPAARPSGPVRNLVPGRGWSGPLDSANLPQAFAFQGDPADPEYADQIIANWEIVQYVDVDGALNIGVLAYKSPTRAQYARGIRNAVAKVSISVENGPWVDVEVPSVNPQTRLTSYWARLDARDCPVDGAKEVRAVAYPLTGEPRVLQGPIGSNVQVSALTVNTNGQGKLPAATRYVAASGRDAADGRTPATAKKTIDAAANALAAALGGDVGGGVIEICEAGTYPLFAASGVERRCKTRWLTIRHAPRLSRDEVILSYGYNWRIELLKIEDCSTSGMMIPAPVGVAPRSGAVWMEDVKATGDGPREMLWANGKPTGLTSQAVFSPRLGRGAFFTGKCRLTRFNYGFQTNCFVRGFPDAPIYLGDIGSDALHNVKFVVNVEVGVLTGGKGEHQGVVINPKGGGFHADLVQYNTGPKNYIENYILDGLTYKQGYAGFILSNGLSFKDFVIANVDLPSQNAPQRNAVNMGKIQNLFCLNVTITGSQNIKFQDSLVRAKLVDCRFRPKPQLPSGVTVLG